MWPGGPYKAASNALRLKSHNVNRFVVECADDECWRARERGWLVLRKKIFYYQISLSLKPFTETTTTIPAHTYH